MPDNFDSTLVSAVLEADEATTPGPLVFKETDATTIGMLICRGNSAEYVPEDKEECLLLWRRNSSMIELFRTAAPALARRVMELEADNERLRGVIRQYSSALVRGEDGQTVFDVTQMVVEK